jgi:hypothetical protein
MCHGAVLRPACIDILDNFAVVFYNGGCTIPPHLLDMRTDGNWQGRVNHIENERICFHVHVNRLPSGILL